jgi:cytochrome c peroxidase
VWCHVAFRTSPLRNLALQPAFFHDGAFTDLEAAMRYHLDPKRFGLRYDPRAQGLDRDLVGATGPILPLLNRLDGRFADPVQLSDLAAS